MRVIVVMAEGGGLLKVFEATESGREAYRTWLDKSRWERDQVNVKNAKVWSGNE